jgi:hypothetical protein
MPTRTRAADWANSQARPPPGEDLAGAVGATEEMGSLKAVSSIDSGVSAMGTLQRGRPHRGGAGAPLPSDASLCFPPRGGPRGRKQSGWPALLTGIAR